MNRWMQGTLFENGTPFGLGFTEGQPVYFCQQNGRYVVMDNVQFRYVTAMNVNEHIKNPKVEKDFDGETHLKGLIKSALDEQDGIAHEQIPLHPKELARPEEIPPEYNGMKIHVTRFAPAVNEYLWMADWWWDEGMNGHIYLQAGWVKKLLAAKRRGDPSVAREPLLTFRHEHFEANRSLQMAVKEFPDALPEQWGGLALLYGGLAHRETIAAIDRIPEESAYNRWIAGQQRALGFTPA